MSLQLVASDPNGDPLTYLATGLPPSPRVDPSTGTISGVVSASGLFRITATASDGAARDVESFDWLVTPVRVGLEIGSISGVA